MKKILSLLMLLCITFGANAQLLWKISGNGLSRPSYVFGTHHLAPISIVDSVADFKQALHEVEQVYGEVALSEMVSPTNIQKIQQASILQGDTTLHMVLTKTQYDSVALVVKQLMGVDLKMFDKVKPAFLTTQIAALLAMKSIKGFNPQEQLDQWIQTEGKKLGKTVGGLETIDFQMYVLFNSQSVERQAELLYHAVTNLEESEQQTQRLNTAYMRQDLEELEAIATEKKGNGSDPLPEEEETLVYGRNANWAKILPAIMKEKSTLVAVGSAHLPGERGLLNLLKKQGFTVEPVN